jgi:hypothetical protein
MTSGQSEICGGIGGRWPGEPAPDSRECPTGLRARTSNYLLTEFSRIDANPNQWAHFAQGYIAEARPEGQESTPKTVNQASIDTVRPDWGLRVAADLAPIRAPRPSPTSDGRRVFKDLRARLTRRRRLPPPALTLCGALFW